MTNTLSTFTFGSSLLLRPAAVRVVTIDGEPWFVAKDVCLALRICLRADGTVSTNAALAKLNSSEKQNLSYQEAKQICLHGEASRAYGISLISESGLYKMVMRSDAPQAKPFQDWVTKVVLPAIRKDGAYIMGEEKVATGELSEDELVLRAYDILKGKVERLTKERDEAKKQLADTREVIGTHMHTLARFVRTMDYVNSMATKRDLLRLGYLYKTPTSYRVYAKHRSLFEEKFNEEYGTIEIYVTEKGKALLIDLNANGLLTRKKTAA